MPWSLQRFQEAHDLHFITFSCHKRLPLLAAPAHRDLFEQSLETFRRQYRFFVTGYVIMPEHVHLLVSEPERSVLATALQAVKQSVSRKLQAHHPNTPFWYERYYDFNVWSVQKIAEKLDYMHSNPVARGLAASAGQWPWSSFRHYENGIEGTVEIESEWTARKREKLGIVPQIGVSNHELPRPSKTS